MIDEIDVILELAHIKSYYGESIMYDFINCVNTGCGRHCLPEEGTLRRKCIELRKAGVKIDWDIKVPVIYYRLQRQLTKCAFCGKYFVIGKIKKHVKYNHYYAINGSRNKVCICTIPPISSNT